MQLLTCSKNSTSFPLASLYQGNKYHHIKQAPTYLDGMSTVSVLGESGP